jgi:hypothetical protein
MAPKGSDECDARVSQFKLRTSGTDTKMIAICGVSPTEQSRFAAEFGGSLVGEQPFKL